LGSGWSAGNDPNVWRLAFKAGSRQGDEVNQRKTREAEKMQDWIEAVKNIGLLMAAAIAVISIFTEALIENE
jgi:hypothetical protein